MRKVLFVLATVLISLSVLIACGGNSSASGNDEKFEIVLLVKTEGIAWFDDMKLGVADFAKDHPDVIVSQIAPEGGDPAKQAAMLEDCIARGVDAICVIPNDPQSLIPGIEKAKARGIIVISHEAQALDGIVDWDLEAFDNESFGALYGENLAQALGGEGKYIGTVGALTMQTHNQWYNAAVKHIQQNYPNMELIANQPYEDKIDATVGYNIAQELLKAYPDLGGYLGMTVEAGISMARLLKEINNTSVKVSCLAMPSASGEYIREGWIAAGQCWRPADAGYVTINIAYKMLKGEQIASGLNLEKPGYESCVISGGTIYGNAPLVFKQDNIDQYSF
jgi:simple sugar transport system substrate-binding protein